MQRRILLFSAIMALAVTTLVFTWERSATSSAPDDSCQESMDTAEKADVHTSRLSFEALPNQFFSKF